MKKHLIALLLLVAAHPLLSQDRVMAEGKEYYVYPYQQEIEVPLDLFLYKMELVEKVHRDSMNRKIVEVELETIPRSPYYARRYSGPFKNIILGMRKVRPTMLIGSNLPLEKDITPYLQPLPDGDYIQYYRDIPYIDGKTVRFRNDIVCARFGLKNNLLDGPAVWYTVDGDTMKFGNFAAGEKNGQWEHRRYFFTPSQIKPQLARFLDYSYRNIVKTTVGYSNGLLEGKMTEYRNDTLTDEGNFHNGEAAGEWKRYTRKVSGFGIFKIQTDEMILSTHYSVLEKPSHSKSIIIRNTVPGQQQRYSRDFNIPLDDTPIAMSEFYKLYVEEPEEGLELPGENFKSYPGEESDDSDYRGGYNVTDKFNYSNIEDISFTDAAPDEEFLVNGKTYTRNGLIDSLGYATYLDGLYEKYYDNGVLMMRFTIENGIIHEPDTVYWNTGAPASVLKYSPERKEYNEIITDVDGKIVSLLVYDDKGKFLRDEKEQASPDEHAINGRTYHSSMFQSFYFYNEQDRFDSILSSPVTQISVLWKADSTIAMERTFDPATREVKFTERAIDKTTVEDKSYQFNEDYTNLNGTEIINFGKVRSVSQLNGSYYVNPMFPEKTKDTLLTRRVREFGSYFEITRDQVIYLNDRPFSGNFRLDAHTPVFSMNATDKLISIGNGMGEKADRQEYTARANFKKNHKSTAFTPFLTYSNINDGYAQEILALFPFLSSIYDQVGVDNFYTYEYEGEEEKPISESKAPQFDKYVEGQFVNGKPEGRWIAKDQHGRITSEVNFVNGELEGEARYYKTTEAASEEDVFEESYANPELKYALPQKAVHHLYYVRHFHRGIQSGVAYELNWLGDTLFYANYADDEKTGLSYERTKIAFSRSFFEYGHLNGIMQTYLTLPGKDSSLLYDLNFRNGALQGESRSYHLNGKLAKHGFFLGGEPIDDFEAYDTLGFKYQYVKFQYGQPVEEKIWEENLLSVRYLFDWKDSIPFQVGDIAGSQSLERELYRLGVYGGDYSASYYGRPSLVNKAGIRYEMTKFYPNNLMARHGFVDKGRKEGGWEYYTYEGRKMYDVNYFDTIITTPAGVRFKSKGILTDFDEKGNPKSKSYIVERFEKYDCAHTDHLEERMLITIWEKDTAVHRMNGFVKNYYDNGVVQNEGIMKNGIATGVWKFYDPYGNLNKVGVYLDGKRDGRWLSGDLGNLKYMGDICLNPNLENLEEIMSYQEKLLDITVTYYRKGVVRKTEYYGINANPDGPPEEGME